MSKIIGFPDADALGPAPRWEWIRRVREVRRTLIHNEREYSEAKATIEDYETEMAAFSDTLDFISEEAETPKAD